ncbi:MAG: RnfABCDGE type electron transport complex subunit C [Firmicutes bacterium]|nr:RnfABCDGE type electron transport complex subunit C [Bacillota bacterium]
MPYVFHGGIYPDFQKNAARSEILKIAPPTRLRVPFLGCGVSGSNHYKKKYASAIPTIAVGDKVLQGQKIGRGEENSCSVYSPIAGTVTGIGEMTLPDGRETICAEIENDFSERRVPVSESLHLKKKLSECTYSEILSLIREMGIVDVGNGNVPLAEKLELSHDRVDICILNCVEDEPYITSGESILLSSPAKVINGMKIILKALGLRQGIIAIAENRPNIIRRVRRLLGRDRLFSIHVVNSKYPASDERLLIYALTRHEVPLGKIPQDIGVVTVGISAAAEVYSTFVTAAPTLSRVITVAGDAISSPCQVEVPIGTSFSEIVRFVGGVREDVRSPIFIEGGPMRGFSVLPDELDRYAVSKMTTGILVMTGKDRKRNAHPVCINCGRCVSACPMLLFPNQIYKLSHDERYAEAVDEGASVCIGCGSCTYVCPAGVDVASYVLRAAEKVRAEKSKDIDYFDPYASDGAAVQTDEGGTE